MCIPKYSAGIGFCRPECVSDSFAETAARKSARAMQHRVVTVPLNRFLPHTRSITGQYTSLCHGMTCCRTRAVNHNARPQSLAYTSVLESASHAGEMSLHSAFVIRWVSPVG